ncbi:ImmA/IrrE family metallo-endopeptidase [Arabiibacter massiliensis]|uniref:ImmA/IrrE family metallo-endopeptidase n=1 Tax=Arabiibacter massiliensis TaxID=1870985 RepID=UPI0009BA80A4|nr:ImmA/IrrE family metallo-endopeptidase [Arabiibacter massiliensis]
MRRRDEAARQAEELRADFGKDNLSPIDVLACAREVPRLTTVAYPLGDSISGMCVKHDDFSLIAYNSAQTLGRQRFTLAHELYHLFFDDAAATTVCPKSTKRYDEAEWAADTFASHFLLPYHALRNELRAQGLAPDAAVNDERLLASVVAIEQKFGISRLALLVRLQDEGIVNAAQKDALGRNVKAGARRLGYPTALYEPLRGSRARMADGDYIDRIADLFGEGVLSQGKAEELLADGFRDDIFIETFEDGELVD